MSWDSMLVWIEHHPGLASWVQAVGSILAIFAAGWFPFAHEQAKERRLRVNTLKSLLHLSVQLRDLQVRIMKSLSDEGLSGRWLNGEGSKELLLTSQLISEIPASMLVGFEMTYLSDMRFCADFACRMDALLLLSRSTPLSTIYDISELLSDNKSKLDQMVRLISRLETDLVARGK